MKKTLFVLTTFNQSKYTKLCLDSLKLISEPHDILVVDDLSTDDTIELCNEYKIKYITKKKGKGLTDSWNIAYRYFKDNNYDYLIIANNDILVPDLSLTEMKNVLDRWPTSLVVPMSTQMGAGHNIEQIIDKWYGPQKEFNSYEYYKEVQTMLLDYKDSQTQANNLYKFDPIRMKMFNGFFFMMNKKICQYEREDGNLFDPKFINVKNEDEFNWSKLIPNDDFPMLCKTSFIYHFKGVSFTKAGIKYSNNLNKHLQQRENIINPTK